MGRERPPAITYARIASPVGAILIAATERGVCDISIGESERESLLWLRKKYGSVPVRHESWAGAGGEGRAIIHDARHQIGEYLAGRLSSFDLPLDPAGTPFESMVWDEMTAIPYGETKSYGDLAEKVRRPKAARAVGMACARNPVPIVVPCHRIIRRDGGLGGYSAGRGLTVKRALLKLEGVRI